MDIRKVHILIEQGLQQVGVFAYDDFEHEEIDLQIDESVYNIIKSVFSSIRGDNRFQYNQGVLDRIRTLHSTDISLSVTTFEDYVEAIIPENYVHAIRVWANVSKSDRCNKLKCNEIQVGKIYKVIKGSIVYNGTQYNEGDTFIGIEGQDKMELVPPIKDIQVGEIKAKRVQARIIESDIVGDVLANSLSKTKAISPVSELTEKNIRVYFSDFIINNLLFSYIRRPNPVNFNFKRYTNTDSLLPLTKYEVIKETVVYNGVTYGLGQTFSTTSIVSFTGTGTVKLFQDGDLVLPIEVCYDVINDVVQKLAIISEQNQQKIVNLVQKDNVPS